MTKTLVTLLIGSSGPTWIRNVLLDSVPEHLKEDMETYYRDFLGVGNVKVVYRTFEVPESFPLALLGPSEPQTFPIFDKEVMNELEKEKYVALVERMVEMERMRVECGLSGEPASTGSSTPTAPTGRYEAWVEELLETLRQHEPQKEDTRSIPDDATVAWIITPVLESERAKKGCRILTDMELGKYWASRLGTDLFPDLVICRRLSTCRWRIRNQHADLLAKAAIDWYVAGQTLIAGPLPGLSAWIQQADRDLASVLLPFQNVGLAEAFHPSGEDTTHSLTSILQSLEGTHILCSLTNTNTSIYKPTRDQWTRYMRHIFRMHGILTGVIDSYWQGVEDCIALWIRGGQGVDVGNTALFDAWKPIWNKLFRDRDSITIDVKFGEFLDTLDLHVPMTVIGMQSYEKMAIANIWIQMFFEEELVEDTTGILHASVLYDSVRTFVFRYCPKLAVDSVVQPTSLAPYFTTRGYASTRTKKGRFITGLRYKNPELWVPEQLLHEKTRKRSKKKEEKISGSILETMQAHCESPLLEEEDGVIHLGSL